MNSPKFDRNAVIEHLQRQHEEIVMTHQHIAEAILDQRPLKNKDLEISAQCWSQEYQEYQAQIFVKDHKSDFEDVGRARLPIFILYNNREIEWVLICVAPAGTVSYRNDKRLPIWMTLSDMFPDEDITFLFSPDCSDFSPLASLINLKILLNLVKNRESAIDLGRVSICDYGKAIRVQLRTLLDMPELTSNEEFLEALEDFINNLPLDVVEDMEKYMDISDQNIEQVREIKRIAFDKDKIQRFVDRFLVKDTTKLIIEEKFPNEMKIFRRIFELMQHLEHGDFFTMIIERISTRLKIDSGKILSFYGFNLVEDDDLTKTARLTHKKVEDEMKGILSIDEIMEKSSEMTNEPSDPDVKDWKVLLEELDEEGFSEEFHDLCQQIFKSVDSKRRKYVNKFMDRFDYSKRGQFKKIRKWASQSPRFATNEDYEALVLRLDHAFFLITGKRLRYTQILALLVFCCDDSTGGRLCQIQTGEGKTVIVALVAIFKALQGAKTKVDIITSSPILANDAVKEMTPLYNLFGLSVDSNVDNNNQNRGDYECKILYGTIGGFQFDYLRDQIDNLNIRRDRNFDVVILDEVDSMLVDNGEHIAQIASPFPGMECLRFLYIKIWDKVKKTDSEQETVISEMKQEIENNIKNLIPEHLRKFVDYQLKYWVQNAFYAKDYSHEFEQYRIQSGNENKLQVVPIDFLNTGVAMKNMIWSAGLTQFIQLKHDIELTFENLTSCFVSNIGFIRKYEKRNIFGLSGTLGSQHEQNLLKDIYEVNFKHIPTYKKKKFFKYEGLVAESELHWKYLVASSAITECREGRATLIVCKTQDDVIKLSAMFNLIKSPKEELLEIYSRILELEVRETGNEGSFRPTQVAKMMLEQNSFILRKYSSEEDVKETEKPVKPGDIILATNIAGRGTDFKTSPELETNGGLHVCVSFLPKNQRVQDQAFGRTSRQGKGGSAQLIIRSKEVEVLQLENERNRERRPTGAGAESEEETGEMRLPSRFQQILNARDILEEKRLEEIRKTSVKDLEFKDDIFTHFAENFKNLKEKFKVPKERFILEDYKEYFALWFEMHCKSVANKKCAKEEYEGFKLKSTDIFNGKISHNPLNCLAAYNYCIKHPATAEKANEQLTDALKISKGVLMHGTYLKLAEHCIDNAGQVIRRLETVFKKMFFCETSTNETYKGEALDLLKKAKEILDAETDNLIEFLKNLSDDVVGTSAVKSSNGRLFYLKLFQSNINDQIKILEEHKSSTEDVAYRNKVPCNYLNPLEKTTDSVTEEVKHTGLDSFSSLTKLHEVPEVKMEMCLAELIGAMAALGVGYFFPPTLPKMTMLAYNLVVDALREIILEMLSGGDEEFNQEAFLWRKCIKFVTMGILVKGSLVSDSHTVTMSLFFVKGVISLCTQNLSPEFSHAHPVLSSVLKGCVDVIEDYHLTVQLNKLPIEGWGSIFEQIRTSGLNMKVFKSASMRILREAVYSCSKRSNLIDIRKIVGPFVYQASLKEIILGDVECYGLRNPDFKKKLIENKIDEINAIIDGHLHGKFKFSFDWIGFGFFCFEFMIMAKFGSGEPLIDDEILFTDFCKYIQDNFTELIDRCTKDAKNLCSTLNKELEDGGKEVNVIGLIYHKIAETVFKKVFN